MWYTDTASTGNKNVHCPFDIVSDKHWDFALSFARKLHHVQPFEYLPFQWLQALQYFIVCSLVPVGSFCVR